jgi:GTP-binding protein
MFIDKATIKVRAGSGGNGSVSFHREKYVAAGGPDGGDGGRGGSIIVKTDPNMSTLIDFRYKRKFAAPNGADGGSSLKSGRGGEDVIIKVPNGTVIRDPESGGIIKDMSGEQSFVLAKGGTGGWGNKHFATPTRQAPRFAKSGLRGQEREVLLELKLLADVGLVGFPNAGKSTLLSVVSKAHPKIADYPFTTLFPNLGVVYVGEGSSFVMADIPGIIEGASDGAGLGHDFLRHIDRCRLLIHVVDVSGAEGRDPVSDYDTIREELRRYNATLYERPSIIAANKCDITSAEDVAAFRDAMTARGLRVFEISAAAHTGVRELVEAAANELRELPPVVVYESDYVPPEPKNESADELSIEVIDDVWVIEGPWLERLVSNVNFSDNESRSFFNRSLDNAGVSARLESMGIQEGDTVSVYNLEFEYRK